MYFLKIVPRLSFKTKAGNYPKNNELLPFQPDSKFFTDSVNLNSAGMKRLTKNWEAIIQRHGQ